MKHYCETRSHEFLNGLCFNDRKCGARGQKVKKYKFIHTADPEKIFCQNALLYQNK